MDTVTLAFAVSGEPDSVTDVGVMAQVVFAGPPLQLSATVPVKPLAGVTVIVYDAFLPVTVADPGETDTVKSTTCTAAADDALLRKFASPP